MSRPSGFQARANALGELLDLFCFPHSCYRNNKRACPLQFVPQILGYSNQVIGILQCLIVLFFGDGIFL